MASLTKNITLLVCLFALVLFASQNTAHARLLVEPHFSKSEGTYSNGSETGNITQLSSGIYIGYIGEHFLVGINAEKGQLETDSSFETNGNEHFSTFGVGTFIGFHFFDALKIWTGYLNTELEPTSTEDYRYYGQLVSYGIGYRVWKGVLISIESYTNFYTQIETDSTGKTTGLGTNIKTTGTSLSISTAFIF